MTDKLKVSLHNHTKRCTHATGEDEEYILAAIENGIEVFGFADHTPYVGENGKELGARMKIAEADEYFKTVRNLSEKYNDKIKILCGLECEYDSMYFAPTFEIIKKYQPDFLIMGQHFLGTPGRDDFRGIFGKAFAEKSELAEYTNNIVDAVNTGVFTYVCHPDFLNYAGDRQDYLYSMEKICLAAKKQNIPIELNLSGIGYNRHYPKKDVYQVVKDVGCDVVIGTDAHTPKRVIDKEELNTAYRDFIVPLGLSVLDFYEIKKIL